MGFYIEVASAKAGLASPTFLNLSLNLNVYFLDNQVSRFSREESCDILGNLSQ
jgi:hypothetical protein